MGIYEGMACLCFVQPLFVACKLDICRKKCLHLICIFLSSANKCLLKVGAYCAQLEQYQKAIEIYEQVLLPFLIFIFLNNVFYICNWRFVSRLEPTRWTILC